MRDTLINIYGVSADSYTQDQKLNTAFNLGEQDGNQGAEYMRQALKDNFGLKIKYYVMLDFETFAEAIVSQVKNPTKLFTGSEAIGKVFAMTSTNMPYSFLFSNGASVMSDASKGIKQKTMPENGDWVDGYDMYGGQGLSIDFDHYRSELKKMGMRWLVTEKTRQAIS